MKETRDAWVARMNRETDRKYRWGIALGYGLIVLGLVLSTWQQYCRCR